MSRIHNNTRSEALTIVVHNFKFCSVKRPPLARSLEEHSEATIPAASSSSSLFNNSSKSTSLSLSQIPGPTTTTSAMSWSLIAHSIHISSCGCGGFGEKMGLMGSGVAAAGVM